VTLLWLLLLLLVLFFASLFFSFGVLACNSRLLFIALYAGDRLDVALSAQQGR
jgi:hypothetical protein